MGRRGKSTVTLMLKLIMYNLKVAYRWSGQI